MLEMDPGWKEAQIQNEMLMSASSKSNPLKAQKKSLSVLSVASASTTLVPLYIF